MAVGLVSGSRTLQKTSKKYLNQQKKSRKLAANIMINVNKNFH